MTPKLETREWRLHQKTSPQLRDKITPKQRHNLDLQIRHVEFG
jgi:hypothetical protein